MVSPTVGEHQRPSPTATRPVSCPDFRCRASETATVKPVASARSANSRVPAWATMPRPTKPATILGREEVRFTLRVPFALDQRTIDKSHDPR